MQNFVLESQLPVNTWATLDDGIPPKDPDKLGASVDVIVKDDAGLTALGYYDYDRDDFCSALNVPRYWKFITPDDHPDIPTYDA